MERSFTAKKFGFFTKLTKAVSPDEDLKPKCAIPLSGRH